MKNRAMAPFTFRHFLFFPLQTFPRVLPVFKDTCEVFLGAPGEVLGPIVDTGAAANLIGSRTVERMTTALGNITKFSVKAEKASCKFSGIEGKKLKVGRQSWIPCGLGAGAGVTPYRGHMLENGDLPGLLALPPMRAMKFTLHMAWDCIFVPLDPTSNLHRKLPLIYEGGHYILPTDKFGGQIDKAYQVDLEQVTETAQDGTCTVWFAVSEAPVPPRAKATLQTAYEDKSLEKREDEQRTSLSPSRTNSGRSKRFRANLMREIAADVVLGRPTPRLTEAQVAVSQKRQRERQRGRPLGEPPKLPLGQDMSTWDFWEMWAPEVGTNLTVKVNQLHFSTGPSTGIQTGWNIALSFHFAVLRQVQGENAADGGGNHYGLVVLESPARRPVEGRGAGADSPPGREIYCAAHV